MLNLVAQSDKKLKIEALGRITGFPIALDAGRKLPRFLIPVY